MKRIGEISWNHIAKYFFFFYSALVIFYQFAFLVRIADFLMLFILVMALRDGQKRREFARIPLRKEWWLFSLVVFLSVIFSIDPLDSLKMFTREYMRLAIMFWATIYFLQTPRDLKGFLITHFIANLLLNAPAIFYFINPQLLVQWGLADESMGRFVSFNQSYTRISFYYLFVLCFCLLYSLRRDVSLKYRLLSAGVLILNSWLLLLTKTRANVVAFGVSFFIIAVMVYVFPRRKFFEKRYINLALILVAFVIFMQPTGVQERILSTYHEFRAGTHSFEDRFDFVHDMNSLLTHEVKMFGYGYSRRIYRILPLFYPSINQRDFIHPHNQLYQWYLEHGVVGLLFFLWVIQRLIKVAYRQGLKTDDGTLFFIFLCALFMGFMVTSTVNHFFVRDTAKLFMMVLGIMNNSRRLFQ